MKKLRADIPRISLTPNEAAASLGIGPDLFDSAVRPRLRVIRLGRKTLIPVEELKRWAEANADRPVAEEIS